MRNKRFLTLLILLVFCVTGHFYANIGNCQAQPSSALSGAPNAQQAISELQKAGITLTPAEIQKGKELLEKREGSPTAEDIQKGKAELEKRKKAQTDKTEKKEDVPKDTEVKTADKTVAETPEDEDSLFSRTRKIRKYQDISLNLKPFGYQFFQDTAAVSSERKDIPVPLSYVVGSGDQVNILLWGRLNAQHSLTVDRDGKITIPQIGPVYVAGMTYEQMSKHLISKAEQIVGTNIDITIGSTRSIPIFVLGDVKRPGAYTTGALATVTDALMMARGPSAIGSMRRVELRRKNKIVTYFDLYDLFLKGDKSRDVTLQAGDVVFVPVTGPQVGIAGNVKRPAIYELKDKFDLHNLIELAGGIIPSAYTQQMQVERIIKNEKQIVIDINDKTLSLVKDFVIQDADMVKVFSIVDMDENSVYLNGNVKRPGKYAFKPGMRIKDLVKDPDDLQDATYFEYALIKRQTPPGRSIVLIPFNLGKLILQNDASYNYELTPKDQVFIFNLNLFKDQSFVMVEGEIRGNSTAIDSDGAKADKLDSDRSKDSLSELQNIKAELNKDVRLYLLSSKIEEIEDTIIAEKRPNPGAMSSLLIELEKVGKMDLAARLKILEKNMQMKRRINLTGNMKVKDAILNAGGLTINASLENGEIIRQYANNEYRTTYFNVARAMADDPRDNLLLQDRDQIIIHSIWEKNPKRSVFVAGDVPNPGTYKFTENMTVRDLIFKSGNVLDSAYLEEAEITSTEIAEGKTGKMAHKSINLRKALEGDSAHNLTLAPNDRLLVKRIADYQNVRFVNLTGQITFAGRYPIRKGEKLSNLIERAGGYTQHAYLRGAYFTRERVRELQQKGLEEMTDRMERDLLSAGTAKLSSASSPEELAAKKGEMEQRKLFIENLKKVKATGRMTIYLTDVKTMKGSEYDFELEDGDSLDIPEKNNVVNVIGSVMSQGSHLYSDRLGYQDYIDATGGYSYYADANNVYVMKVDGSARKVSKNFLGWSSSRNRWEMTARGGEVRQIEPGDSIVVPEKAERIAWLREIKDITQILMNIAVVAGVVIRL
ncbi:MAG: SLBB domain-containing protein [Smithellaceae bacterium]|nr:SLBB domain-containing protein [Smithellaceae bacterium]